jgi:hypothetical protein
MEYGYLMLYKRTIDTISISQTYEWALPILEIGSFLLEA